MRLVIEGHHLPGLGPAAATTTSTSACSAVASRWSWSPRTLPTPAGRWTSRSSTEDGERDFRGPEVQGKRGERFVYLTWGTGSGDDFEMFRRAKLMLAEAPDADVVRAVVHLTDEWGMPRCARLRPPALEWRSGGE